METYPEMDAKIADILRADNDPSPAYLYAARRTEELEELISFYEELFRDIVSKIREEVEGND